MKAYCYLSSAALVAFGLLFAHAGFYSLAVQSLTIGLLAVLLAMLTFRR
jgi:hypothetical protein